MITRIIIQDEAIYQQAEKSGRIPAGWYSRQQIGAHEEREIRLVLEGTDRKKKPQGDFIYWEKERGLNPKTVLGSNP